MRPDDLAQGEAYKLLLGAALIVLSEGEFG